MKKETRRLVAMGVLVIGWMYLYERWWRKTDLFLKPHERFTRYAQQSQDQQQNGQS